MNFFIGNCVLSFWVTSRQFCRKFKGQFWEQLQRQYQENVWRWFQDDLWGTVLGTISWTIFQAGVTQSSCNNYQAVLTTVQFAIHCAEYGTESFQSFLMWPMSISILILFLFYRRMQWCYSIYMLIRGKTVHCYRV